MIQSPVKWLKDVWNNGAIKFCGWDFMEVLTLVKEEPQLVLMDIECLFNGYHWCQEIRKISTVYNHVLSSRDQAMDIVMAINMGGDDYVTKPFDNNVFLARCKDCCAALMSLGTDQNLLEHRGAILNLKSMDLIYLDRTFRMNSDFTCLFGRAGSIICRKIWWKSYGTAISLLMIIPYQVNVARLRKKTGSHQELYWDEKRDWIRSDKWTHGISFSLSNIIFTQDAGTCSSCCFGCYYFFSFIFEDSRVVLQYFCSFTGFRDSDLSIDSLIAYKNYHNQLLYGGQTQTM